MADNAHTTPSRCRNNLAPSFGFPDLEMIVAARVPGGAFLTIETDGGFAEEMALLSKNTVCPVMGGMVRRQVAAFYREGDGRAVRVDIGDGTGVGDSTRLVLSVADALALVLPLVGAMAPKVRRVRGKGRKRAAAAA